MSTTDAPLITRAGHAFVLGKRGPRALRSTEREINLFLLKDDPASRAGDQPLRHLLTIPAGTWLFDVGFETLGGKIEIQGDHDETALESLPLDAFPPALLPAAVKEWTLTLAGALLLLSEGEEEVTHPAKPGNLPPLPKGTVLGIRGGVGWWLPPGGGVTYLRETPPHGSYLALISRLGVELQTSLPASRLLSSEELLALPDGLAHLSTALRTLAEGLERFLRHREIREQRRALHRQQLGAQVEAGAWTTLSELLLTRSGPVHPPGFGSDAVEAAYLRVAAAMGIERGAPVAQDPKAPPLLQVAELARADAVRWRQIVLKDRWFEERGLPMIGVLSETKACVALLNTRSGHYRMIHADGRSERLTEESAQQLEPLALTLYRSLPARKLTLRDILAFALYGSGRDGVMIGAMIILTGLLGLATPALSARIYDVIIPQSEHGLMTQITLILLVAALTNASFGLVRTIALMRIENRAENQLQAAVWDRLLKLPSGFFRHYTAGDLANRVQGVSDAHQILSSTGVTLLFTLPVGLFNLVVMFYHSVPLAFWGLGLAIAGALLVVAFNVVEVLLLRRQYAVRGRLAGLVVQLINGVAKFRLAHAEAFAFATWARQYSEQEELSLRVGRWNALSQTVFAGFSLTVTAILFGLVGWKQLSGGAMAEHGFSTGAFLAFHAAFGALIGSLISVAQQSAGLLSLFPLLERIRPILTSEPEVSESRAHPGELQGEIEVSNLHFAYGEEAPPVLQGLSLKIKPGEMVAIVGPSGCGKSTLLRLLLGFENPASGSIFYDGKDLASLNLQAVRRQVGVVLQSAQLFSGDLFRNIVGESNLPVEAAWEAAEMAGLADDIRAMPMQMYTVISEGGGGFSGGQRQRLAIARAFVNKPRLLFFDEATSALDNRTQSIVTESMERLQVTRIVIAHRLSTIVSANRIIVLHEGKVAEEGSYDELLALKGRFYELAKHQLA